MFSSGCAVVLSALLIIVYTRYRPARNIYKHKHVIVIGGSSGLGLAVAHELHRRGAHVTITSRDVHTLNILHEQHGFGILQVDVTDDASVHSIPTHYDIVFCCAGLCIPALASDLSLRQIHTCMSTNFYGSVRVYLHFLHNTAPPTTRTLVFISSTLALHSFIGYAAYSPSKSALYSFFQATHYESKLHGINTAIYHVSTIDSPGLAHEDTTKPQVTKDIEGTTRNASASCFNRANHLLDHLPYTSTIFSDTLTRLFYHGSHISSFYDFVLWLVSPLFIFVFSRFCTYHTNQHYRTAHTSMPNEK